MLLEILASVTLNAPSATGVGSEKRSADNSTGPFFSSTFGGIDFSVDVVGVVTGKANGSTGALLIAKGSVAGVDVVAETERVAAVKPSVCGVVDESLPKALNMGVGAVASVDVGTLPKSASNGIETGC